jgi:hypothetical protein
MDEIERNKLIVRKFFKDLSNADIQATLDAYDDDVTIQTMGNTLISGTFDKTQARKGANEILGAFPQGIRFEIRELTAEDDRVAAEAESFGTHVSGRFYSNKYHFFFRLRTGLIIEFKEYMDTEMVTEIMCGGQRRS